MQNYLHLFEDASEFNTAFSGEDYHEPWVSFTKETSAVTYNKKHLDVVDLGLPSGTLWATKNLGAATPEGFGSQYAWGELTPKTTFTDENYRFYVGPNQEYSKYNTTDQKPGLEVEDDAAAFEYPGTGAHIPTLAQAEELFENTTRTLNLNSGQLVTSVTFTSTINQETLTFPVVPTEPHSQSNAFDTPIFWVGDSYLDACDSDNALAELFSGLYGYVNSACILRYGYERDWASDVIGIPIRPVIGEGPVAS
jgi:hypothetical protein